MTQTIKFINAKRKVYSILEISSSEVYGVNEFSLLDKLKILAAENDYEKEEIQDALTSLIDEGYVGINYPENSFEGFYKINK